ncbi:MAG: ADP-ribosyltransferase [Lachnospiraceae bacterium]|nr:ADP-ribosyltransferase [Lachnospiraceae bacterium]
MNVMIEGQVYREFYCIEETEMWARKYYADLLALPKENELHKMISYYTGSYYKWYNKLLRDYLPIDSDRFRAIDSADIRDDIKEIQKIIEVLCKHSLPENIIAYRFTHKKDIRSLCNGSTIHVGSEFSDKAFYSTTLICSLLNDFRRQNHCNCLLKLYLPKGLPGAYVSLDKEWSCLDEQEFLLPPNIKFKILKIHHFTYPLQIECMAIYG